MLRHEPGDGVNAATGFDGNNQPGLAHVGRNACDLGDRNRCQQEHSRQGKPGLLRTSRRAAAEGKGQVNSMRRTSRLRIG